MRSASLQTSTAAADPQGAPVLGTDRGRSCTVARWASRSRSGPSRRSAGPGGTPRSAAGGRGRARRRAPRPGPLGQLRRAGDVDLPAERRPVEEQGDPGVGLDLVGLARPQGRGEEQGLVLDPLQVDGPAEGRPAAPTVAKATEPGCGMPSARASAIQRSSSRTGSGSGMKTGFPAHPRCGVRSGGACRVGSAQPRRRSDVRLRDRRSGLCRMRAGRAPLKRTPTQVCCCSRPARRT